MLFVPSQRIRLIIMDKSRIIILYNASHASVYPFRVWCCPLAVLVLVPGSGVPPILRPMLSRHGVPQPHPGLLRVRPGNVHMSATTATRLLLPDRARCGSLGGLVQGQTQVEATSHLTDHVTCVHLHKVEYFKPVEPPFVWRCTFHLRL